MSIGAGATVFWRRRRIAIAPHSTANAAYAADHAQDCVRLDRFGSIAIGKVINASIEPAFESAKSLYGIAPGFDAAYHACKSGPVVDRAKYGNPMDPASTSAMPMVGSAPPAGFHDAGGITGNTSKLAVSSPRCTMVCVFGLRNRMEQ